MATPIIKWAGGKRQLLPEIKKRMPKEYNRYYEPFFGGGALFFDVEPHTAVINDANIQLINVYRQIRRDYVHVCLHLLSFEHKYNGIPSEEDKVKYYNELRSDFNNYCIKESELSPMSAALFIFLNKSGYNGLYRVNRKGEFNVPSAKRKTIISYDLKNMKAVSSQLQHTHILSGDFERACERATKGDFVFFDSPYYDTFDNYQANGFSEDDHLRLANLFNTLTEKGVKCMLTNNDCDFIKDLYKGYYIDEVDVRRNINSDASKRTGKEVIIRNYKE